MVFIAMLFLDRHGVWHEDGVAIRHARLSALLHRSIARDENNNLIVSTGKDRLPFACEDTPLLVTDIHIGKSSTVLHLSNNTPVTFSDTNRVTVDDAGCLRIRVGNQFWARVTRAAAAQLHSHLVERGTGFWLVLPTLQCPIDRAEHDDFAA
jgi:Protein of unknown function (DUF1285)